MNTINFIAVGASRTGARGLFDAQKYCLDRGYGEEIAAKVKDMSWSDLHIINQKTAMEVWLRSQIPAKAEATQTLGATA